MRTLKLACLTGTALFLAVAPAAAQQKKVIATAADLPRVQVQLPAKPSEIALAGALSSKRWKRSSRPTSATSWPTTTSRTAPPA